MKHILLVIVWALVVNCIYAQIQDVDYAKIYKFGLDTDIKSALTIIESYDAQHLNDNDKIFVERFKNRFSYDYDKSDYLVKHNSIINNLFSIYHDYWRKSLLSSQSYDSLLVSNVYKFLKKEYANLSENTDTLDLYLKKYINDKGYFTTGFGRVGRLYDLLVWKDKKDTIYHIQNKVQDINVKVEFMTDFVSLGWEDYATLGKHFPGGWAKEDKLCCVKDGYDITSEKFKLSYLPHECQHFSDYKNFPDLTSYELEYRAKLVEVTLADERLFSSIEFFINNSNRDSKNGHPQADYYVISNLSKSLFGADFESDIRKWKQLKKKKINKAALKLLHSNNHVLKKKYKSA